MAATGDTGVARDSSLELSVVIPSDDDRALDITLAGLACDASAGAFEVVVARAWPACRPGSAGRATRRPGGVSRRVKVLDVAAQSLTVAANAALAAATGRVVVLLAAGDVPEEGMLERHRNAHAGSDAAVLVGAVRRNDLDPVRDGWVGPWPEAIPAPPVRHLSALRRTLIAANGLDERIPDLDVAVVDLLVRLRAEGIPVRERRDLRVAAPSAAQPRAASANAGRAAQVLAATCLERGTPTRPLGRRHARVSLRWLEPGLLAIAGRRSRDAARLQRLVLRAAFARGLGRVRPLLAEPARGGPCASAADEAQRPSVALVVPFAGAPFEGEAVLDALAEVRVRPGDELVVVDNSAVPVLRAHPGIRIVRAAGEHSSYHARNVGVRATTAPWVAFVDADCRPAPDILDAYFAPPPGPGTGAIAGAVLDAPGRGWAARFSIENSLLAQPTFLARPKPWAIAANLMVRREALERLGGFVEGVRSAGDVELSWRLADEGFGLEYRSLAAVEHRHRNSMRALISQYRRYGAGYGWLRRHVPAQSGPRLLTAWPIVRDAARDLVAARFELAASRATSFVTLAAHDLAALSSNRPEPVGIPAPRRVAAFARAWPDAEEPVARSSVAALGEQVAVEARRRPRRIASGSPAPVAYAEDDAPLDHLAALVWLASTPRGWRTVAAAAVQGGPTLRALAADACVARRVAAQGAAELLALDDDPGTVAVLARVADLLALPISRAEITTPAH